MLRTCSPNAGSSSAMKPSVFGLENFGVQYAKSIRQNRPPVGDKWHLDEVVISIRGKKHWLWRAVDQNGNSLEILVQSRRNTQAAKRFMRKLMKQYGAPRVMITDKLRSYGAAKRDLTPGLEHRSHKGRFRTNRPEDGNGSWGGSNLHAMPNSFFPPMIRSMFYSDLADTD